MQFFPGFPGSCVFLLVIALSSFVPPNVMPPGGGKLCAIFPGVPGLIVLLNSNSIISTLTPKPNASGRGETMCIFSQDSQVYFSYYD